MFFSPCFLLNILIRWVLRQQWKWKEMSSVKTSFLFSVLLNDWLIEKNSWIVTKHLLKYLEITMYHCSAISRSLVYFMSASVYSICLEIDRNMSKRNGSHDIFLSYSLEEQVRGIHSKIQEKHTHTRAQTHLFPIASTDGKCQYVSDWEEMACHIFPQTIS